MRCAFFIAFSDHFMCVYRHLRADNHPVFLSKYVLARGGHHVPVLRELKSSTAERCYTMMDNLRTAANSVVLKIIFGIIIVSFILTGVSGYLIGGGKTMPQK